MTLGKTAGADPEGPDSWRLLATILPCMDIWEMYLCVYNRQFLAPLESISLYMEVQQSLKFWSIPFSPVNNFPGK